MKITFRNTTLMLGLLAGSVTLSAGAQSPRIVVGIVVDQLRTDYLEQLRPYFGDKGFNRLFAEGVYIPDVDFHHSVSDASGGTSVIYTGAWPSTSGVGSVDLSPEELRVSTLADEFVIHNGTLSKAYSISGDRRSSIVAAGHTAGPAIWFDDVTGRWNSPSYYGALPPVISNKNRTSPLSSRIASSVWRPLNPASRYQGSKVWQGGDFSYTFSGGNRDAFSRFKATPGFNAEVTDAAIDLLSSLQSAETGMIGVGYTLAPVGFDYDGDNRPELVDSYVRLDTELGRLLDSIDKVYGRENAVVFLSSSGYAKEPAVPEHDVRIPSGEITLKRAESLLNSYLSASFGNGDYVSLIRDGKLYLDAKGISSKGLDIKTLRKEAKDFLLRMGGVSEAFTVDEVLHADNSRTRELALGVDPKNAPDVFLLFQPGWTVTDDGVYPPTSEKVRMATPLTPAFIMAPGVSPQTISYSVDATAIAPTVAGVINIRAPNAASSRPLPLKGNN